MRAKLILAVAAALAAPAAVADNAARIDQLLSSYHALGLFNGTALVAESGKVIHKKGYGMANFEWNIPLAPDTRFRIGSITKQFTALLVMQLVESGKVRLEAPMSEYLPTYPKKVGDRVTVHHLLTHTSGIPSYTGLPRFSRDISRDPYQPDDFLKVFHDLPIEFDPGTKYRYNNSGYFLLGVLVEKVTGKPFDKVLEERITRPLALSGTGYDWSAPLLARRAGAYERTPEGVRNAAYLDMSLPYAAGSMYSTVEDLFAWNQALHDSRLISKESTGRMMKIHIENYGYGLATRKEKVPESGREITLTGHGGGINGFNTVLERVVEDGHVIVLLNNTGGAPLGQMTTAIRDILYGKSPVAPKKPLTAPLYTIVRDKGAAAAVEQYKSWKSAQASEYDFGPGQLVGLGSYLRDQKRHADAIEILKLATAEHPKASFAFSALGDAYRDSGNRTEAIRHYAKALDLAPDSRGPAEELKKLTTQ